MKYTHINTLAALAGLAITATSANAALLAVDFNGGSSPIATGFLGQNSTSAIHSTTAGNITVTITGAQGFFDRGTPSGTTQVDQFYRDFVFDNNSNGFTIELSGAGVGASTEYILTFYAYDSGEARRTAVAASAGTTGTTLSGFGGSTTAPTTLAQYAQTGSFTSNASNVLTFFVDGSGPAPGTAGRSSINGFELNVVPEPSTTALLGLGGLALVLRRRK